MKYKLSDWPKYTEDMLSGAFSGLKSQRVELFVDKLGLGPDDIVLDLGSEDGGYLSSHYPWPHNIIIADINEPVLQHGVEKNGLKGYRAISGDGPLPFEDGEFDAVWCNSVIEHVTVDKDKLGETSNEDFASISEEHQASFAAEVQRVGKKYFLQTPYIHFPIESHSVLPFIPYLPFRVRYRLGRMLRSIWIKQWNADFHLYNMPRFKSHFPTATEFYEEKALGLVKSIIALRY